MSYFAIEHNQKCLEHVVIKDQDGNVVFGEYRNMTYDQMKSSETLDEFVVAVMDATGDGGDQTLITLVGDDDVFIWSIIIGRDGEDLRYVLVDWTKDGRKYKYESQNTDLTN